MCDLRWYVFAANLAFIFQICLTNGRNRILNYVVIIKPDNEADYTGGTHYGKKRLPMLEISPEIQILAINNFMSFMMYEPDSQTQMFWLRLRIHWIP